MSVYLPAGEIHPRAWSMTEPTFLRVHRKAEAKYRQLAGIGKATGDLNQLIPPAHAGKVESLFVDCQALRRGSPGPSQCC